MDVNHKKHIFLFPHTANAVQTYGMQLLFYVLCHTLCVHALITWHLIPFVERDKESARCFFFFVNCICSHGNKPIVVEKYVGCVISSWAGNNFITTLKLWLHIAVLLILHNCFHDSCALWLMGCEVKCSIWELKDANDFPEWMLCVFFCFQSELHSLPTYHGQGRCGRRLSKVIEVHFSTTMPSS